MDWSNDETDYTSADNYTWNKKNALSKTTSVLTLPDVDNVTVCSQGIQVGFGNREEFRDFTSALDRLDLEPNEIDASHFRRTNVTQTDPVTERENDQIVGFRTRELSTFRLVIQGPEILNFQGTRQAPEDVAPYWKKDSRMWLWKSVRLARKRSRQRSADLPSAPERDLE